jgi:hypothetical protein
MRLAGIVLGAFVAATPAAAQLIDRDAVFARAREVAVAALVGVESADLAPFRIDYDLTLLETGDPAGGFEVDLLLRSSREVIPARDVVSAAPDAAAAARLEDLLAGAEFAFHYRTVRVRFAEQGDTVPSAELSTLLLNRDPERPAEALSSESKTHEVPIDRRNP